MSRKKRILWVGEASFLNTGFAVYGKEVMSRLYSTGKYELAELSIYGGVYDQRRFDLPWTYYGNLPSTKEEDEIYQKSANHQWGAWRFEEVLLDFKPDIVFDVRDWWMLEFAERTPLRNMFYWAIMPTIDSAPQREQWLNTYLNADAVCSYAEFGRDVMMKESNGKIKFRGIAPPAADYLVWKPAPNKKELREFMGLEQDINIVGTVMRNQKRKLYPELIVAFKEFLNTYQRFRDNTYLYCHTAYPDVGWDMPRLVKESGIGHKILFTYLCHNCKYVFPSFFQDALQSCPRCRKLSAKMPTSNFGVDSKQLSDIVNCFDVYVQYAICEGFGMPQVEAAACGIPVMAVNYSAMESVVNNLKGMPINVKLLFRECETHAYRAYPDHDDFIAKLANFLSKDETERRKISARTYSLCKSHYNWDKTTQVWENVFDTMPIRPDSETWNRPPRIIQPNTNVPNNLCNEDFVKWCVINIWGEPNMVDNYITLRMIRDLNYGHAATSGGDIYYDEESAVNINSKFTPYTREMVVEATKTLAQARNYWEQRRAGLIPDARPNFIKHAKREGK